MLVPGVANRDARAVYEARERRLRAAIEERTGDELAIQLAEAARMGVWRGHSIVAWEAFVEDVLGLGLAEARELKARGAELIGSADPAPDELIASWMRAEAGLLEGNADGVVHLRGPRGSERLVLEIPAADAPTALSAVGRRLAPIARDQAENVDTVLDRAKGARRIERPRDDDER